MTHGENDNSMVKCGNKFRQMGQWFHYNCVKITKIYLAIGRCQNTALNQMVNHTVTFLQSVCACVCASTMPPSWANVSNLALERVDKIRRKHFMTLFTLLYCSWYLTLYCLKKQYNCTAYIIAFSLHILGVSGFESYQNILIIGTSQDLSRKFNKVVQEIVDFFICAPTNRSVLKGWQFDGELPSWWFRWERRRQGQWQWRQFGWHWRIWWFMSL